MPTSSQRTESLEDRAGTSGARDSGIDEAQLARLAETVLNKSPADLAALAATAPNVAREWIEAFGRAKAEAEAAARFYSAAMASLSTVAPMRLAIAAE